MRTTYREGKSGMIDLGALFSEDNYDERQGRKSYRQIGRYQGNRPIQNQQFTPNLMQQIKKEDLELFTNNNYS